MLPGTTTGTVDTRSVIEPIRRVRRIFFVALCARVVECCGVYVCLCVYVYLYVLVCLCVCRRA